MPDQAEPEAAAVGQRATAILFAIIGGIWWQVATGSITGTAGPVLAALGIAHVLALVVMSVRTLGMQGSQELMHRNRRMFGCVNAIQAVAIAAVVPTCSVTNNPEWITPLVTIIVGLHFLPFAPAFRLPALRFTGFALIAFGVFVCVLAATTTPISTVWAVGGLGTATVLWATGWFLVMAGRRSATWSHSRRTVTPGSWVAFKREESAEE